MKTFTRRAAAVVLTSALSGFAAIATAVVPISIGGSEGEADDTARSFTGEVATPQPAGEAGLVTTDGKKGKPGGDAERGPKIPVDADIVLAGASVVSIFPDPPEGEVWETDEDKCTTLSEATLTALVGGDLAITDHLASTGSPWPENPNCIYMGGFDIGPMNPIVDVDDVAGLYVRSVAAIDGEGDAVVLTIVDGEGWFWEYASKCPDYDCGSKDIAASMAAELGIDASGIVIAATHSHAAPDFIGGWGFVPDWYMRQVAGAIKASIREAVTTARPAVIEIGEDLAREHNNERRQTYRSAEEQHVAWFRALAVHDGRYVMDADRDAPSVVATVGAYAGHPTKFGTNGGVAHADWPGIFENRLEERFGGAGLHFMTGLGNMSASGNKHAMGIDLANELPAVGTGTILTNTDIRTDQVTWRQPTTNVPLTALAVPGFFDHPIDPEPAEVRTGKEPATAPCVSGSPFSAEVPASAMYIGPDLAITAAPGEVFANFTNTVKETSKAMVTLPLGQANDALGYMPQSFEINPVGQQGLGFVAGGYVIVNYEDSYAIDRCFGDMALEQTITMLDGLRTAQP